MAFTTIVGNVGGVELKFTPQGKAVCEVSAAENHNRKNEQTGQWETESTTWRRVVFWENQAEAVAEQVQKGDRVIVTGDEKLREDERNDGSKGASLEMRGRHIGKVVMPLQNQQQQSNWQQPQSAVPPTAGGGGWNAPANDPWGGGGTPQGGPSPF